MSFKVTIQPSGHFFEAVPQETLLEAALRSGMNVNYSCNSGSCGECKARVIQGDVATIRHHDFSLTEAEKLQDNALLCCVEARSDLVIETHEAITPDDIPFQEVTTKVVKLDCVTNDNILLHLRTPRSKSLRFLAGQMVSLQIAEFPEFNLPVASCPCNGMVLQFHILRDDQKSAIKHIFDQLKHSDSIRVSGPHGNFTLEEASKRPIVMVAEGTGLAPVKSLIEHAITLDLPQSMTLFWIVDAGKSHYLSNYCRSWELALDCFVYIPLFVGNGCKQAYESTVNETLSRCPIETEIDLYLAGSKQMLNQFQVKFLQKGTPQSHIKMLQI